MSERQNLVFKELGFIFQQDDLKQVINDLNLFLPSVFNCERGNIWVLENSCGVMHTYNGNFEKKCIINKGIIGEIFQKNIALNIKNAKQKPLLFKLNLETSKDEGEFVENTLLLPIFVKNGDKLGQEDKKIKAIIELSNCCQEFFSHDEEYLGIVVAEFIGIYLSNKINDQVNENKIKYYPMIVNSFEKLCQMK